MSVWSTIASRLKEILKTMIGTRTIAKTLHVAPMISSQMEHAIEDWSNMYIDRAPWIKEPTRENPVRVASLGLPAMIASEKARTALIEWQSEITTPIEKKEVPNENYSDETEPDVFGNLIPSLEPKTKIIEQPKTSTARAEYLNAEYEKLKENLREQLEYAIAKGGMVIKPYPVKVQSLTGEDKYTLEFDFIQADCFYPLAFNASKQITEAAFLEVKSDKDIIYYRLEYHKWDGLTVTIINKAFKTENTATQTSAGITGVDLGHEIALSEVPEWSALQPTVKVDNVEKPLFAYFKMPESNTIDTKSPLGVSGYSRARNLIKDADMQYSRMLWEYEAGEMAIDIDRDALQFLEGGVDRNGKQHGGSVLNNLQARLYRKVDLGESNTFVTHAPALRDSSFITGLNTILMRIEDVCAISRGTLSDASQEARTATELKILKQRSYQANVDIQTALEKTLRNVVYIMNVYCSLYKITPEGEYDVSFEWDDSIIVDVEQELNKRLALQQNGLASKLETRMWYFGETERQAEEALMRVEEENRKSMESDLILQSNLNRGGEE